ncbi:MAG: molybdopterin molybdotransferase MoeA [Terriglobales bacterium]
MPNQTSSPGILSFEEARHCVEAQAGKLRPGNTEVIPLLDSVERVLAEPVLADRDFPPFNRATRDGYAVRAADLATPPASLEVTGEIKAGASIEGRPALKAGQALAIMTGAPVPPGADAVVMVEYSSRNGNRVKIARKVATGENIVPAGSEAKKNEKLLSAGDRLNYASIAVAASVGKSQMNVFRKPSVAVLSTGDEVVGIDGSPDATQIRNSNSYSLAAQIQSAGGEAIILPIAPDEPIRLLELIEKGFEADLLLMAGGVSMGKYDLVEAALSQLHAEFFFTGVQIQPGRPLVFGRYPKKDKYFFGLPGNPVSTMVTFELFVKPLLDGLAGVAGEKLKFLSAKLGSEIRTKTGLTRFLPASLCGEFQRAEVSLVRWQGSGDIAATAKSNCYIVVPSDREQIAVGEWVSVMMR